MGPNTRDVFHRRVSDGLEVAYKEFVGDDSGFPESLYPVSDIKLDLVTSVSNGEEGIFNDHLVWDDFEMDGHVDANVVFRVVPINGKYTVLAAR